jgi:hypothetical protein
MRWIVSIAPYFSDGRRHNNAAGMYGNVAALQFAETFHAQTV